MKDARHRSTTSILVASLLLAAVAAAPRAAEWSGRAASAVGDDLALVGVAERFRIAGSVSEGLSGRSNGEGEVEFTGLVESIGDAVWKIGGREVLVNVSTEIRGAPAVGRLAEVEAIDANGILTAVRIKAEDSGDDSRGNDDGTDDRGDGNDDSGDDDDGPHNRGPNHGGGDEDSSGHD